MPKKVTTTAMPESQFVEDLRRLLSAHAGTFDLVSSTDERMTLPQEIVDVLREAVDIFHQGSTPHLHESDAWVTTQQAADIVGVSRPSLIKLLNASAIPYSIIGAGSHRRILLKDVIAYRDEWKRLRGQILADMVAGASANGFYDMTLADYEQPLRRARGTNT